MRKLIPAVIFVLTFVLPARTWAARLSIVVDGLNPSDEKILGNLQRDFGTDNKIEIYDIKSFDRSNPIRKGRWLADVADADLIIPIGDSSAELVSSELEDLKTFFISAASLSGDYLKQPYVAGVLSYSPEETVRVAKALFPNIKVIGVIDTPGYEEVVARMSSAAQNAGLSLTAFHVESRKDIGPIVRETVSRSDFIWVAGDPLLTQDLIFSFLLQEALRAKKPVASPLSALVAKGAIFCTIPDDEKMSSEASESLSQILAAGTTFPTGGRIRSAPSDSSILLNRALVNKWSISIPSSLRLWGGNTR